MCTWKTDRKTANFNVIKKSDCVLKPELWILQKSDRFEHLKASQEKLSYHINKLETIMRMVDNDAIPLDQVGLFSVFSVKTFKTV